MGIIKDKLNEQINIKNLRQYNDTTGTILEYDPITNRAKIKFNNPNGGETLIRENVPVSSQSGGFTQDGIRTGMQCSISFYKNNIFAPVITGTNNSLYNDKTCSDQGACLVNENISLIQKPENIIPMSSQWIDENNYNSNKYNNDLGEYQNIDVTTSTMDMLTKLDKYSDTEQGITNLETKSTIKTKENGDIDIFVSNNVGIRISNTQHKIYLYGDFYINNTPINYIINNISGNDINISNVSNKNINDSNAIKKEIINNINSMIPTIDDYIKEIELCIEILIEINGNNTQYDIIYNKIDEYKNIISGYNEELSVEEIQNIETRLQSLKDYFELELDDAQSICGGAI